MRRLAVVAVALAVILGACTSSPTPHPGQEDLVRYDTYTATPDGSGQTAEKGPDLDSDGVPDCEQVGGLWDQADGRCLGGGTTHLGDADAGDADADDGDAPDATDADDDATQDAAD